MGPAVNISVREMEMIRAILEHGTMAKAAVALNISQPAISRMVKHAEDRSGLSLFERRGTRLLPTPDLMLLAVEFQRVFSNVERVQKLAVALRQGWGRPIRVISMAALADAFLPRAVAELNAEMPQAQIAVRLSDRTGVERELLSDNCDLGLLHGISAAAALGATELCRGDVVCLVPQAHRLAAKPEITPRDLAGEKVVSMGRRSPLSRAVTAVFEAEGQDRRILAQIADSGLAARFAVEGLGIALLDPFFLGTIPHEGMVVRPFRPRVTATCYAVYRRDRELPELERVMLRILGSVAGSWRERFAGTLADGPGARASGAL